MAKKETKSALSVSEGVRQPDSVNKAAVERFKRSRRPGKNSQELFQALRAGHVPELAQAITLVESARPEHKAQAQELIGMALPHAGNSLRIGITGVPGAGKSTFIEAMGNYLIEKGHKLAVLAIDPSSERSKGSILGDKTRMETLSGKNEAFIRPSPSGGTLGGVARKTRESIILCEAAGFDIIFVETVGVGQSETTVHSMVDFFLVLMIPGAGDELQGMKRGIMELADAILINKADGDNISRADRAKTEYTNALHLFPLPQSGWAPRVLTCSSLEGTGIVEVWQMVLDYREFTMENAYFPENRTSQGRYWFRQTLEENIQHHFFEDPEVKKMMENLQKQIANKEISSFMAAKEIMDRFFS